MKTAPITIAIVLLIISSSAFNLKEPCILGKYTKRSYLTFFFMYKQLIEIFDSYLCN